MKDQEQPEQPTADQRAKLRAPLMIKRIRLDDGEKAFFGYSTNLSCSGLFISTVNPADPGSRFQIEIPLPEPINRDVRCQCETVWKRSYSPKSPYEPGMGLRFIDLSEEDKQEIDTWAKAQQADNDERD
ncbi:PilZ domain-containing protein [Desulfuromonas acetoxidans]|uniref:Type IV pilus assembly PilZ n=1 Tax=Desulfuromonas acetoxidans (strain DSM 684 / 11070) TaxID=281689 RepID=Q1K4A7_DESA6|nr:PilZ domain-containing protein [Desulfuromonas acetoxidans]EAT17196.1 type IV pilus assembly PilZ [Desulfuromonas acetoxidans DSM 684]MBF0645409.1 PilZ domain-containing protein [Desulfuromonas acetoxidans]NVD24215.1 PilZ domain-containing protein [Desulfuromonas acetoxidans]NVE15012.1 PilZ domain-containing protein [Desulfuromonas acetoxidans]